MKKFYLLLTMLLMLVGASPMWAETLTEGFETVTRTDASGNDVTGYSLAPKLSNGWVCVGSNGESSSQIYTSDTYAYCLWSKGKTGSKSLAGIAASSNDFYIVIPTELTGDVSFSICCTSQSTSTTGYVEIYEVTDDGDGTYTIGSKLQQYTKAGNSSYTWEDKVLSLGTTNKMLALRMWRAALDDFSATIYETGAIPKPTAFTNTATTYNSATFSWTAGGEETAWQLVYGTTGFDKSSATPIDITENPYTLTGLSESTTYDAYLRAKDGEDVSSWSDKVTFTTPVQYPAPTAFTAGAYTATSQTFSWTNGSTETAWQIKYSTDENFDPASEGTSQDVTTNPYTLTGLTAETTYYAYLRANYGTGYCAWSDKVSFTPSATVNTTVNDGTTTNFYIPVYGNWVDNVDYNKSQFVIPSTSLTAVNGRDITKLTFYTNASSTIIWTGNVFDIYMKETDATTVATSLDRTGNKVYTGSLSVAADGKMEITLGESFPYEGGNLQFSFDMTTKGIYTSTSFYGVTGSSGVSMYTYNGSGNSSTFLPKITISSVPGAVVAVKKPKSLEATSVLATQATLNWTDGEDGLTAWEIKYDTNADFAPDTEGTLAAADANPFTLTGLTAETTYYAYVRAKKGGDVSDWSNKVSFTTPNAKPTDVVVSTSDNSAQFSWTTHAGETAWQMVYSTDADFDKAAASPTAVTTNPYTLTGLVPETTYYAYLRADLGGGEYSEWTDKLTFTTGYDHELTVHDKTDTNSYVPVYGSYCDSYLKAEFVIPASELASMNGQNIQSMKFYLSSKAEDSWGDANFQVFLKEVGSTTIAAFSGTDGATTVYEGALDGTQDVMTINFTSSYTYNGGNLLVGVYNTVKGTWKAASFYGENVTGSSVSGYSSSSLDAVTVSQRNFIPKTTFTWQTVTGPRLAVSTEALDFGEITQASTAEDKQKTFTISNSGAADLTGLSVAVSGAGYSVSALPRTTITTSGEDAADIELTVTFAPTASGSYDGTITISATNLPSKEITLSATYVADPIMGVFNDALATEAATTGQTIDFGLAETAPTYTYYIKNTGAGTLDIAVADGGLAVSPANASLAAGEQQAFTITANVANANATVTFTGTNHDGGAAIGTFAVTLQGTVMPLSSKFFEGFNYADGNATTTELDGWEVNNNTENVMFYNGYVYYWASGSEKGSIVTPKLHVSGTTEVMNYSAYARNLNYNNTSLVISYSADKENWTEVVSKDKSTLTASSVAYEFSGIPEGNWYIKIEMSDVAVGYVYGFSSTLTTQTLDESEAPTLNSGIYDVTLKHKFNAGWNTVCLPFAFTNLEAVFGPGAKAYAFTNFDNSAIKFSAVDELDERKPYVVYVPAAINDDIIFNNVTVNDAAALAESWSGVYFRGTYAPVAAGEWTKNNDTDVIYGVTPEGKIMKAGDAASIKGFRAYFDVPAEAAAKGFAVEVTDADGTTTTLDEQTPTGIDMLNGERIPMSGDAPMYNISGQQVDKSYKGIVIANGKKYIVK